MHPHARAMLVCTVLNQFVCVPLVERAFARTTVNRAFALSTHPQYTRRTHTVVSLNVFEASNAGLIDGTLKSAFKNIFENDAHIYAQLRVPWKSIQEPH